MRTAEGGRYSGAGRKENIFGMSQMSDVNVRATEEGGITLRLHSGQEAAPTRRNAGHEEKCREGCLMAGGAGVVGDDQGGDVDGLEVGEGKAGEALEAGVVPAGVGGADEAATRQRRGLASFLRQDE